MSYDKELGYDPDQPITIKWEGDMHPEQITTDAWELEDGFVQATTVENTEYGRHPIGQARTVLIPAHRIYSITVCGVKVGDA